LIAAADDLVVLSSWHGRWSDTPRAIGEELLRRRAPLRLAALVGPDAPPLPDGVEAVPADDPDAERAALEAARWIVSNDIHESDFVKRPDATYLQTWHGTPLKRIGFDVVNPRFPDAERHYAVDLGRDVARWDLLLSPNRFSTEVLPRAFGFTGRVLETGYPRNDVLQGPAATDVRARVRAALGVRDGQRAVLYAPTWRDTFEHRLALDLGLLRDRLGDDVVVLVRAHGLTAASDRLENGPGVRNVTRWGDVSELYLAADVLLTDYSSAMVDFAITRRPILLYTHDLAEYRDELRGFYVDFEAIVPGPMLTTSAQVAEALADVEAATAPWRERYTAFRERFCHHDDGRATERVVDLVFAEAGTAELIAAPG
jgi:CDP-glycerol glycerophosphotransferase